MDHHRPVRGGGCAMTEILHHNDGRTLYVLSGKVGSGSSALLLDPSAKYTPYIAVAALYEDCWRQGTYCETLKEGIDALRENRGLDTVRW